MNNTSTLAYVTRMGHLNLTSGLSNVGVVPPERNNPVSFTSSQVEQCSSGLRVQGMFRQVAASCGGSCGAQWFHLSDH